MTHDELEAECRQLTSKLRAVMNLRTGPECQDRFVVKQETTITGKNHRSRIFIQCQTSYGEGSVGVGVGTPDDCYNMACRYIVARL